MLFHKNKKIIISILILVLGTAFTYFHFQKISSAKQNNNHQKTTIVKSNNSTQNKYNLTELAIEPQNTYGELMAQANIPPQTINAIFKASQDIYDLSQIRVGHKIKLFINKNTKNLEKLIYQIDTEEELTVTLKDKGKWQAQKKNIPYDIKIKTVSGTIKSSLYETGLKENIDEVAIIKLANVFQWTIDFAMNIQKGDYFKFIYEERYLNGEYIMPGHILAAKFINNGHEYQAYYFKNKDNQDGYYNEKGESMQKMFLKAPVAYKYISSGFTTGRRYVSAFNVSTGHRAIDYAAPYGTPIKAVGDGTVVFRGWGGPYGNKIGIRHNSTYRTNYCHLSKFAVQKGQKVKQGQVIGYVGSTGFSTGPHVHYEMVKNGIKINPQTENFPNTDALKEAELIKFKNEILDKYQKQL